MKKISSKIIISLVLAAVLWGGGIDTHLRISAGFLSGIKIRSAEALTVTPGSNPTGAVVDKPTRDAAVAESKKGGNFDILPDTSSWFMKAGMFLLVKILYFISLATGALVTIAGGVLDMSINYSIIRISEFSGIKTAIESVWMSVRNIMNVTFIFVLLWISIKTILGLAGSNTKKMLTSVIVAALLINFSLFITRIILDAGNLVAVNLYNGALSNVPINEKSTEGRRISSAIMDGTKVSALYRVNNDEQSRFGDEATDSKGITSDDAIKLVIKIIITSILFWAFLTASFLFFVRIGVFIILMILSPIGFVGEIIPYLKPQAKKWWDTLYDQALVAPVFLFFLIIILKLAANSSFQVPPDKGLDTTAYFNFGIITVLIVVAVKITKKLSGEAGAALSNFGASVIGMGVGLATGGLAMAGRGVIGKTAAMVAESDKVKGWAANNRAGRMLLAGATATSKATFDARNAGLGTLTKKIGIDIGKGGKNGFAQNQEAYNKQKVEFARKSLGRDDLTEDKAVNEYRKIHGKTAAELENIRYEKTQLENELTNPTVSEERKKILTAELNKANEKIKNHEKVEKAQTKDQYGNYTEDAKKVQKEILEERKKAFQKEYADNVEKNKTFRGREYNKAAAAKIRKEVIKGKSDEEKLAELAVKIEKERKEKEEAGKSPAAASSGGTTSGGSGASTSGGPAAH